MSKRLTAKILLKPYIAEHYVHHNKQELTMQGLYNLNIRLTVRVTH